MNYDFYTAKKSNYDLSNLSKSEELHIVSFKKDPNYTLNLDNDDVGTLDSKNYTWSLQIDVHKDCGYVNTWLYKLGGIPDAEQQHFAQNNIYARELSPTAHRRWVRGIP